MPALTLDAAFVHMNLGDAQGNAAYTGIDPYFDDLFLMSPPRTPVPVRRAGGAHRRAGEAGAAAGTADQPDDGRHRRRGARWRALHHRGTRLPPRREVPAALRRGGAGPTRPGRSSSTPICPADEADYQAAVRKFPRRPERQVISVTRAEVCAVACAELFRDAGEIMVSPMTTIVSIGARLARLTFSPDIVLTDGEARLLADTPAIGVTGAIEGWMPFGRVFETLAWGRRHVVMGANQIDRYGNQNLSAFGPLQHPTRQMFGVRGAPGNTINHATSYWVGNHSTRVFGDSVDMVVRHRLGQGRSRQPGLPVRQRLPGGDQPRRVRLQRAGPPDAGGVAAPWRRRADEVAENTCFEVHDLDSAETTRLPAAARAEADPGGHRSEVTAGQGSTGLTMSCAHP